MQSLRNIKNKRFFFYCVAFLVGFAPFLPVFYAPDFLKEIVNRTGELYFIPVSFVLIVWGIYFLASNIYKKKFTYEVLFEAIVIPLIFMLSIYWFYPIFSEFRYNFIVSFNDKSKIEKFVNPFLGTKMLDCRQITDDFEVLVIPEHFDIETDLLLYSSKEMLNNKYGIKRTISSRWFFVRSGSQWGDTFRNCWMQNKSL